MPASSAVSSSSASSTTVSWSAPITTAAVSEIFLTIAVPACYFIEILRDIYLKGLGIEYFWKETLFILVFGFATLALAAWRFHKRLD